MRGVRGNSAEGSFAVIFASDLGTHLVAGIKAIGIIPIVQWGPEFQWLQRTEIPGPQAVRGVDVSPAPSQH